MTEQNVSFGTAPAPYNNTGYTPQPARFDQQQQHHPHSQYNLEHQQHEIQAPTPQTMVVRNPAVHLGSTPCQFHCPNCNQVVTTEVSYQAGMATWLFVFILVIVGFWLCFWIPLVMDECKDAVHNCSNCGYVCGITKKLGDGAIY